MTRKSTTCFKKDGEPLSEYSSEYEASEGASYVKYNYGTTWVSIIGGVNSINKDITVIIQQQ